ncbi:MAG: glycogen synthase [Deltaproteobacteria bacterium]|nr:glycogen synthase [Deltaproteobacteria bacterium]
MFVVMVASECSPVAKVGGLADVVFGLSRELEIRGNAVEIILPKYDCLRYDHIWDLQVTYHDLWVPWYSGAIRCTVWFGYVHGRKCFFIDPHEPNFFRRGVCYGYGDDEMRFAFFTKAALEFLLKTGKRPDVLHFHDWQTSLGPVLLYEIYKYHGMDHCRACYTIHNFKFQGVVGYEVLWATGLGRPWYYGACDRLRDDFNPRALNLMKGALVYSNFVTTVSPRHAWEVRQTEQGRGLGHQLHVQGHKFGGILNGIDYDVWNPEKDPFLPFPYSVEEPEGKYGNKRALRGRFLLRDAFKPIVAFVGRLDEQKGVHLIRHGLFYALSHGAQFVLLGVAPERPINDEFWRLKLLLNDNPDCHLELSFNEELSHLVYAGADMLLVPSLFEPCGLAQMIALKYGTVPIVRGIGGLADTVFDRDYDPEPVERRNGYVFYEPDETGIESALYRAIGLWNSFPEEFRDLSLAGMRCDYSWNHPGQHYLNVYEQIRNR